MLQSVARRVPPVEQELLTFPVSHGVLSVVRATQSLVFCVVFCQIIVYRWDLEGGSCCSIFSFLCSVLSDQCLSMGS